MNKKLTTGLRRIESLFHSAIPGAQFKIHVNSTEGSLLTLRAAFIMMKMTNARKIRSMSHQRNPKEGRKTQTTENRQQTLKNGPNGHFHMHLACDFKIAAYYEARIASYALLAKVFPLLFQRCNPNLLCIVEFHMFYVINSDKLQAEPRVF